jgi:hypothetical protein
MIVGTTISRLNRAGPIRPARAILAAIKSEREMANLGAFLVDLTRRAHIQREHSVVTALCHEIRELPLPLAIQSMATYYSLLSDTTDLESSREKFLQIACNATPGLRERALLQAATTSSVVGDLESATHYALEAAAAARGVDPLTHIQALRFLAICKSIEGDHSGALADLRALWLPTQAIRRDYPADYLEYLNSLAVELGELGRIQEALSVLAIPLASSVAERFPNWLDTKREIAELDARGANSPPLVFAIGSVVGPAIQLECEARAEVSNARPEAVPETVRVQEAEPLAQPNPAHSRAIATSRKREAIPLAAIPLVKLTTGRARPPAGTSAKCSILRCRPRPAHAFWRYIRGKPARAPPTSALFP